MRGIVKLLLILKVKVLLTFRNRFGTARQKPMGGGGESTISVSGVKDC